MQKALAPDISTWPDEYPQLIGSRCAALQRRDLSGTGPVPEVQFQRDG